MKKKEQTIRTLEIVLENLKKSRKRPSFDYDVRDLKLCLLEAIQSYSEYEQNKTNGNTFKHISE